MEVNDRPIVTCAIQVGVHTYRFGSRLTRTEQEWLVTELASFIRKPQWIEPHI